MNKNYIEFKKGLFIKKNSIKQTKIKYNNIKTKVFDLDGTLLNGYALSIVGFKAIIKKSKKLDLKNILAFFKAINLLINLKKLTIEKASERFANIITGLVEKDFLDETKTLNNKIYKNATKHINYLVNKKNKLILISLSDKNIIIDLAKNIKIKNFNSRELNKKNGFYTGKFKTEMHNAKKLKLNLLKEKIKSGKFIYFGNDIDDELILKKATIKIGINPKKELINKINFDIISIGNDPWENINLFFNES
jgi:phosphoserine phosphatase